MAGLGSGQWRAGSQERAEAASGKDVEYHNWAACGRQSAGGQSPPGAGGGDRDRSSGLAGGERAASRNWGHLRARVTAGAFVASLMASKGNSTSGALHPALSDRLSPPPQQLGPGGWGSWFDWLKGGTKKAAKKGRSGKGALDEEAREVITKDLRMKSMMSLKSMLVLGKRDEGLGAKLGNGGVISGMLTKPIGAGERNAPGEPADVGLGARVDGGVGAGPLPEALKYLLLRCLVASLDKLSWRVWQVGGWCELVLLEIQVGGVHEGWAGIAVCVCDKSMVLWLVCTCAGAKKEECNRVGLVRGA